MLQWPFSKTSNLHSSHLRHKCRGFNLCHVRKPESRRTLQWKEGASWGLDCKLRGKSYGSKLNESDICNWRLRYYWLHAQQCLYYWNTLGDTRQLFQTRLYTSKDLVWFLNPPSLSFNFTACNVSSPRYLKGKQSLAIRLRECENRNWTLRLHVNRRELFYSDKQRRLSFFSLLKFATVVICSTLDLLSLCKYLIWHTSPSLLLTAPRTLILPLAVYFLGASRQSGASGFASRWTSNSWD